MYSILLVDDEPLALRGNRLIIERSGLEIAGLYEAVDGQEAWEFLQNHEVDLVITDIKMPRKDGVSLCRELFLSGRQIKTVDCIRLCGFSVCQGSSSVWGKGLYSETGSA